jgi:hypothetical protein
MSKVTKIVPEVKIESSIDFRITKNDVIELMLEEEEQRLKAVEHEANLNRDVVAECEARKAVAAFKKKAASAMATMADLFPGFEWKSNKGYRNVVVLELKKEGVCGHPAEITVVIPDAGAANIKAAENAYLDAYQAVRRFQDQGKKGRVAMTRKLLEQSEEGQAILAQAGVVGKLLLGGEIK